MIEVFTTDIPTQTVGDQIMKNIKAIFPELETDFDLEVPIINYPCDHSIIRVEGSIIDSEKLISLVNNHGFQCHILEDKICIRSQSKK
ncbi:hypothetical protein APR41_01370 [Salegentibacter salinarum]|uniref:HMA domain-containing protein n=1 Tax=Salegentibacter salinarum TaxID=447422 RepID=A0A2N0U3T5_9FLAO|nr:hypothetical protein [Salegentibacter salinarum]PKD21663.1 hypothetical protein APR41_01370 [Salegentibacter salinarum]SKB35229.1 hypothetical protein SAMN05660903_00291 [Salegentibacter salinarum]